MGRSLGRAGRIPRTAVILTSRLCSTVRKNRSRCGDSSCSWQFIDASDFTRSRMPASTASFQHIERSLSKSFEQSKRAQYTMLYYTRRTERILRRSEHMHRSNALQPPKQGLHPNLGPPPPVRGTLHIDRIESIPSCNGDQPAKPRIDPISHYPESARIAVLSPTHVYCRQHSSAGSESQCVPCTAAPGISLPYDAHPQPA